MDHHREVHECRCPGTRLELLPAGVAVGLASELLWLCALLAQSSACRPVGAFLPHVVMATGGSRYDGIGWAGGKGGSRVGHHILSHSGHFKRSPRV